MSNVEEMSTRAVETLPHLFGSSVVGSRGCANNLKGVRQWMFGKS